MRQSRLGHTLTAARGRQGLAAGGADPGDSVDQASADIYDPLADTWTTTASMHAARTLHSATLLRDGTVLVAGGRDGKRYWRAPSASTHKSGRWTEVAPMHGRRSQQVAVPFGAVRY